MKKIFKFLVKQFGFLFEDYPLESGISLVLISVVAIYLLRNRIFYIKNRGSILQYFLNLRTISFIIGFIGISQILKGLDIYDSILKDLLNGLEFVAEQHPVILGSIIIAIGAYLIYDKYKSPDEEPFHKEIMVFYPEENKYEEYKLWFFCAVLIFIGASMIIKNI